MTTNPNLPPEKFVNHILATVADPKGDTDNICAVIEAVWKKTQTQVVPKTTNDVVLDYVAAQEALHTKVERVRKVIRNTLTKRNLPVPPEYAWVATGFPDRLTIKGVFRKRTAFGKELVRVKDTNSAPDNFLVQVEIRGVLGSVVVESIPVSWFSFSDGELSKMVRHRVRAIARENKNREIGSLKAQKKKLERELEKLNFQIEESIAAVKK